MLILSAGFPISYKRVCIENKIVQLPFLNFHPSVSILILQLLYWRLLNDNFVLFLSFK